jgi:hypothetical protein
MVTRQVSLARGAPQAEGVGGGLVPVGVGGSAYSGAWLVRAGPYRAVLRPRRDSDSAKVPSESREVCFVVPTCWRGAWGRAGSESA